MKKVLVFCMAILMVVSTTITAFAAPGFVVSPSTNSGPTLEDYVSDSEECNAYLKLTPYSKRNELSEQRRKELEDAYGDIVSAKDLIELLDELEKLAEEKGIPTENLAVSDLFDLHYEDCDIHDDHGAFRIKIKANLLENFVGFMVLVDGKWQLIDNAYVDGEYLIFKTDVFSPFAIIVDSSASTSVAPQTGENAMMYVYIALMAVSAVALVAIAVKYRKRRAQ